MKWLREINNYERISFHKPVDRTYMRLKNISEFRPRFCEYDITDLLNANLAEPLLSAEYSYILNEMRKEIEKL